MSTLYFNLKSKDDLLLAALVSRMSYGDTLWGAQDYGDSLDDLRSVLNSSQRTIRNLIPFYKNNGILAGIALETDREIFLSPHGTDKNSFTEAFANFRTRAREFSLLDKVVHVHGGYLDHFLSCRSSIMEVLQSLSAHKPVVCVGHSLGGAVAGLLALDLCTYSLLSGNARLVTLVTFGCPRYEYPDAAELSVYLLGERRLRVIQESDWVVSSLVAQGSFLHRSDMDSIIYHNKGYVHCGATVVIGALTGIHRIRFLIEEIKRTAAEVFLEPIKCEFTALLDSLDRLGETLHVAVPPLEEEPSTISSFALPDTISNSSFRW